MALWSKAYTGRAKAIDQAWLEAAGEALRAMSDTIIKGYVTPGTAGRTIHT